MSKLLLVILLATLSLTSWGKNWKSTPKAHLETSLKKCKTPCEVKFDARKSKSKKGKKIEEYLFSFGDGKVLKTSSPVVTYTYKESSVKKRRNNHYRASLRVRDANDNWSKRVFRQIKVEKGEEYNAPPISSFSYIPLEPVAGDLITLSSQATDDKTIASYEWIISDGRILYGEIAGIIFDQAGTYTVRHRVRDEAGLVSEISADIMVSPKNVPPVASLTASVSGSGPFEVTLDSSGSIDDENVLIYEWYLDEQFLGTTSIPNYYHQIPGEGTYKFKVKVSDSKGLSDSKEVIVNIEKPLPEGIFISGEDSIDLIPYTQYEEHFFYVKENVDGELRRLNNVSISMSTDHPDLTFEGNRLLINSQNDLDTLPDSVILSVDVVGVKYTKIVTLNRLNPKLLGTIPAGILSNYTIASDSSVFNGSLITFKGSQFLDNPVELYESILSNGMVALSFKHNATDQPLEFSLSSNSSGLKQAADLSQRVHTEVLSNGMTVEEIKSEYREFSFLNYASCSLRPSKYYVSAEGTSNLVRNSNSPFPVFYLYSKEEENEEILLNEERISALIENYKVMFEGVTFVFMLDKEEASLYASVLPYFRNVIWVNMISGMFQLNDNEILGTLLHEKRHVEQFNELGCHHEKLPPPLRNVLLESNAQFEALVSSNLPSQFSSLEFARNTIYSPALTYMYSMEKLFTENGISPINRDTYYMGAIWDHLSFTDVTAKIKDLLFLIESHKLYTSRPSESLKNLLGEQAYFEFVSDLLIYNHYPNQNESVFTAFVSNLYNFNPYHNQARNFYTPQGQGTAQKINSLKPFETALNIVDFNTMTSAMDESTKENLRFKFLVYPSTNENLVEGFEHVHVALSSRGETLPRVSEKLWLGHGQEPLFTEFVLDFNKFEPGDSNKQVQVVLTNGGSEKEVPVYTTVIPEIKKKICYNGPSALQVTFMHKGDGHLEDYDRDVRGVVPSGTCQDFYLAYNVPYFYEFIVITSDPYAVGYLSNWNQDNYDEYGDGFIYNFNVLNDLPIGLAAELVSLPDDHYRVSLKYENISANTVLIY